MPEISRFLGIVIKMFFHDHPPPHFHAFYQGYMATFNIRTGEKIEGEFPKTQESIVTAWAVIRKKELLANWNSLSVGEDPKKVAPLR